MLAKTELPTVDERCETCRYWECMFLDTATEPLAARLAESVEEGTAAGFCRRFPPPVTKKVSSPDSWPDSFPRTIPDDWCGEWRAKGDVPPPIKLIPARDDVAAIAELLRQAGESGVTPWQVKKSLGKKSGCTTREKRILRELVASGVAEQIGRGTAGHPFKYRLKSAQHNPTPPDPSE